MENTENNKSNIEDIIFAEVIYSQETDLNSISDKDLRILIEQKIKEAEYLKEDWQIHYAVNRIIEKIEVVIKRSKKVKRGEIKDWRRNFLGRNFLINFFISFFPISFFLGLVWQIGIHSIFIDFIIIGGLMLVAGLLRENIKTKKQIWIFFRNVFSKVKKVVTNKTFVFSVLTLVLVGTIFYWFSYRPVKIRHDCSWVRRDDGYRKAIKIEYDFCIHEKGLK